MDDATLRRSARHAGRNARTGHRASVLLAEAHAAYEKLGFAPSPGKFGNVAAPDGRVYFTSRGSLLGQVAPDVVAAAFGVFNPVVVVPGVRHGWTLTDAPTIFVARRAGAVAELERVCGTADERVSLALQTG